MVVSVEAALVAVMDGASETALLEAGRLAHAGELATGAGTMDTRDAEAIGAVFRAIDAHLEIVGRWTDTVRTELIAIRSAPSTVLSQDENGPVLPP